MYVMRMEAVVVILIVILIKVLIALKALEAPKASVSAAKLTTELNAWKDCIVFQDSLVFFLTRKDASATPTPE